MTPTPSERSRRDRIVALLEHYRDVLEGLQDGPGGDDLVIGMCRAWNHPSYQELERVLRLMRTIAPAHYRPLAATYLNHSWRRMMRCTFEHEGKRCKFQITAADYASRKIAPKHMHSRKPHQLHPTLERIPAPGDLSLLGAAIDWVDARFRIDPSIPPDLLGVKEAA